jgi:hypothetical protein
MSTSIENIIRGLVYWSELLEKQKKKITWLVRIVWLVVIAVLVWCWGWYEGSLLRKGIITVSLMSGLIAIWGWTVLYEMFSSYLLVSYNISKATTTETELLADNMILEDMKGGGRNEEEMQFLWIQLRTELGQWIGRKLLSARVFTPPEGGEEK